MKKTIHILLLVVIVLVLGACTRNHGDIGIWFGTWHVEGITIDGASINMEGDYFFQFQSKVFRVSQVKAHEHMEESFGTWEESQDGRLTVTFPDAGVFYVELPGLEAYNDFAVNNMAHGQIALTKVMTDGATCTFTLRKQP